MTTTLILEDVGQERMSCSFKGEQLMPRAFRFGVVASGLTSREGWISLAHKTEDLGYSSLLMPDRPSMGGFAPLSALSVAATVTKTLRIGSYVFSNDYRHPILLAKEAATLDQLSDGRFEFGLGAGVGQPDYSQMGLNLDEAGVRVSRFEESVQIIKRFFTEERVNFTGKYYTIADAQGSPKSVQRPHPPLFVGSAGKRMLHFAAREVNSIAPVRKWMDPYDVSIEEKIGWVREAAGDRFAQIELCQTNYDLILTDSHVEITQTFGGPAMPKRTMSTTQAIDFLSQQRDQLGFSYIQVSEGQVEHFAPIVARLAGH